MPRLAQGLGHGSLVGLGRHQCRLCVGGPLELQAQKGHLTNGRWAAEDRRDIAREPTPLASPGNLLALPSTPVISPGPHLRRVAKHKLLQALLIDLACGTADDCLSGGGFTMTAVKLAVSLSGNCSSQNIHVFPSTRMHATFAHKCMHLPSLCPACRPPGAAARPQCCRAPPPASQKARARPRG